MEFSVQFHVAPFSAVQEVELIGHHSRVETVTAELRLLELEGSCEKENHERSCLILGPFKQIQTCATESFLIIKVMTNDGKEVLFLRSKWPPCSVLLSLYLQYVTVSIVTAHP